ncbi:MAG: type II toxin-antitoxin system Phd/YefM family antitoxin [Phycisphaerales bacterium]
MRIINIQEAKAQLSHLIEEAARGESFVIAKAGKPMVRVSALDAPDSEQQQRIGFLKGQIEVPEDFDEMGRNQSEPGPL